MIATVMPTRIPGPPLGPFPSGYSSLQSSRFSRLSENRASQLFYLADELVDRLLGVPEQHHGLGLVVEVVLDPGEARVHAALEDDDVLRLVHVQDRHAVDGAGLVFARCRV